MTVWTISERLNFAKVQCITRTGVPNQGNFIQERILRFQGHLDHRLADSDLLEYLSFSRFSYSNSNHRLARPMTALIPSQIPYPIRGGSAWRTLITNNSMFYCNCILLPPTRRLCFRRCLSVSLLATLRKNVRTDLHEIFRNGWQRSNEQMVKFWWRSGSRIRIRIRIVTLVIRVLAEVYTSLELSRQS